MPRKRKPYEPQVPKDIWGLPDGNHMGLRSGFERRDGKIYPAPMYVEPMEAIRVERRALQAFVDSINQHVHRELQKIERTEADWWARIESDLGIQRETTAYYFAGYFEHRPPEPKK